MRHGTTIQSAFAAAALMAFLFYGTGRIGAGDFKPVPANLPFTGHVLIEGLDSPWELLWGPDGKLWVTERAGPRVSRIDPATGEKKVLAVIPDAVPATGQEGLLGMAFAPGFLQSRDNDFVYLYYTTKKDDDRWGRIAKYKYDREQDALVDPVIILDRLPAGNDHNAGRMRFGPDGKLYCTIGEQGHNQFGNACLPIEAQRIPTVAEIQAKDWDAYRGKSLRLDPDGAIPADNPEIKGVRSHVFTYGHRNPQGLAFVGDMLYSCEHGPSSDDELNLLVPGGNYGWPHVAGFRDNQGYAYANYSAAPNCADIKWDANVIPEGVPVQQELDWFAADFQPPVKTFYTVRSGYNFSDPRCGNLAYLCWPTVAPSSLIHYPADGAIPAWRKSLLMTTLKTGALFQIRLSGDEKQVQGDYTKYFHSANRMRAIALDPAGKSVYIATDSGGNVMDENGNAVKGIANPGAILVYTYTPDKD